MDQGILWWSGEWKMGEIGQGMARLGAAWHGKARERSRVYDILTQDSELAQAWPVDSVPA